MLTTLGNAFVKFSLCCAGGERPQANGSAVRHDGVPKARNSVARRENGPRPLVDLPAVSNRSSIPSSVRWSDSIEAVEPIEPVVPAMQFDFGRLPTELAIDVLSRLDRKTLVRAAAANAQLRQIILSERLLESTYYDFPDLERAIGRPRDWMPAVCAREGHPAESWPRGNLHFEPAALQAWLVRKEDHEIQPLIEKLCASLQIGIRGAYVLDPTAGCAGLLLGSHRLTTVQRRFLGSAMKGVFGRVEIAALTAVACSERAADPGVYREILDGIHVSRKSGSNCPTTVDRPTRKSPVYTAWAARAVETLPLSVSKELRGLGVPLG